MTNRPTSISARDRAFAVAARLLALLLLPVAMVRAPGHARYLACQWALATRFPTEDLAGLTGPTREAFASARTEALWRDHQLIGLTSGHRDAAVQYRMYTEEVRRSGSVAAARMRVLPPEESSHVKGIALDVRPTEGARWLEHNGGRYDLYRCYDNEWWHFEHRPETNGRAPDRLPHPGATPFLASMSGSLY